MADEQDVVRVEVQIYGEHYVIRSEQSDAERIRQVSSRVDVRMRELHRRSPELSGNRLAVLTALNLADELARLQQQHRELLAAFTRRVKELERAAHDQS